MSLTLFIPKIQMILLFVNVVGLFIEEYLLINGFITEVTMNVNGFNFKLFTGVYTMYTQVYDA